MHIILALVAGICLAAACGFRVFVPLLIASIGVHLGWLNVGPSFNWLGSDWALALLGVATATEVAGYYIPWVDHALDTVSTPAAAIAGTLMAMSQISGLTATDGSPLLPTAGPSISPAFGWIMSAVLGGGAALIVQLGTVALRIASTATTGGLANPIVSTFEHAGAVIVAALAILVPVVALIITGVVLALAIRWWINRSARTQAMQAQPAFARVRSEMNPRMAA
jgi:hypothetical protein